MKPTHTHLTYTRTRPHVPSHQAGDHPVPAHTERHNPRRCGRNDNQDCPRELPAHRAHGTAAEQSASKVSEAARRGGGGLRKWLGGGGGGDGAVGLWQAGVPRATIGQDPHPACTRACPWGPSSPYHTRLRLDSWAAASIVPGACSRTCADSWSLG